MTDQQLEQRLRSWYHAEIGDADRAPAALRASVAAIPHAGSTSGRRLAWPFLPLIVQTRFAVAAVIGVLAVGGALYLLWPSRSDVGTPSPTPGFSANPSQPANPTSSTDQTRAASWSATGSMTIARNGFSATLLPNGKVLVAGGDAVVEGIHTASAELYDPASGVWTETGSMAAPRASHTATLLPNGKVLVAGGGQQLDDFTWLASAELYDPATGTWTATGSMATGRGGHTATLLRDGRVLVVGGETDSAAFPGNPEGVATAELYDPATGTWTATASMPTQRFGHTATLLGDGRVLVAGGACCGASPNPVPSAALYDPTTGSWLATGSMAEAHMYLPATLLLDGKVLVLGASTELYDPGSGSWTATGTMITSGLGCSATLLLDGNVLVAGGGDRHLNEGWGGPIAAAEVYDPGTGLWTATASMASPRCGSATLLHDGRVLVAGGAEQAAGGDHTSVELYNPGTGG